MSLLQNPFDPAGETGRDPFTQSVSGSGQDDGITAAVNGTSGGVQSVPGDDVGLYGGFRQGAARLRLNFLLKLLVLKLAVALEGDAIDDRSFDDGDDQPAAGLRDPDILE